MKKFLFFSFILFLTQITVLNSLCNKIINILFFMKKKKNMSISPTLNATGCARADLNENLARHATYPILFKIRKLSLNMHGGCPCLLCTCFIFFSFGLFFILEHIQFCDRTEVRYLSPFRTI